MAKMYFAKTVRYLGTRFVPNTVFEVADADVTDLKAAGGWVIEEKKPVELVKEVLPLEEESPELLEPVLSDSDSDQEELEALVAHPRKQPSKKAGKAKGE